MARPGRRGQLCAERSQPRLTGRLFSSPGFLGENQRPPRRCQQLHHTHWKGKDPARLLEKRFSASIYGSHFGLPLPGWGATPGGLRGAGTGLVCAFPQSLSQGPKLFFQVLFQDTLISSIPALAAWGFFFFVAAAAVVMAGCLLLLANAQC